MRAGHYIVYVSIKQLNIGPIAVLPKYIVDWDMLCVLENLKLPANMVSMKINKMLLITYLAPWFKYNLIRPIVILSFLSRRFLPGSGTITIQIIFNLVLLL